MTARSAIAKLNVARRMILTSAKSDRRPRLFAAALLLIVITWAVYGLAMIGDFVDWDDPELIVNNALLRPDYIHALHRIWALPYAGLYAPLTYTLYRGLAMVSRAAGSPMDPMYFHLTSILLHSMGGLLLWLWLRRLCGREMPALLGALFWIVHPMQVEAVAWASSMNTVLGGVLGLAALLLATLGVGDAGFKRWAALIGSVFIVAASVAAKPSGVLLPLMLVAVHRLILRRTWKETLLLAAAWIVVILPFALIGMNAQVTSVLGWIPSVPQRFLVAGHAIGFYLLKTFWPVNLGIDYGLSPDDVLQHGRWIVPSAIAIVGGIFAITQYRRRPWVLAGSIIFIAGIGPVLGFVPFLFQVHSTVADRYAYVSLSGVAIIVTFLVRDVETNEKFRTYRIATVVCTTLVLILFSILSARQVTAWHDTASLLAQAYRVNPTSTTVNAQLGFRAFDAGDYVFAEQAFRRVLARNPRDTNLRANLADLLIRTHRPAEAVVEFKRVILEQPENARDYDGLGLALAAAGHDADALQAFATAEKLVPAMADAPADAGDVYLRRGDLTSAAAAFARALAIYPHNATARAGLQKIQQTR